MPIGVDIFSGAGGLSLGAEMAGVQIRFAVEKDKSAAETYSYNHPNTLMLQDDIHNIKPNDYLGDRNAPLIVLVDRLVKVFLCQIRRQEISKIRIILSSRNLLGLCLI